MPTFWRKVSLRVNRNAYPSERKLSLFGPGFLKRYEPKQGDRACAGAGKVLNARLGSCVCRQRMAAHFGAARFCAGWMARDRAAQSCTALRWQLPTPFHLQGSLGSAEAVGFVFFLENCFLGPRQEFFSSRKVLAARPILARSATRHRRQRMCGLIHKGQDCTELDASPHLIWA